MKSISGRTSRSVDVLDFKMVFPYMKHASYRVLSRALGPLRYTFRFDPSSFRDREDI